MALEETAGLNRFPDFHRLAKELARTRSMGLT
jgi:hypothetical protein